MTDEEYAAWPNCAVPACQNKCCLRLRSRYCWPHTPGMPGEAADNLRETEPTTDGVTASSTTDTIGPHDEPLPAPESVRSGGGGDRADDRGRRVEPRAASGRDHHDGTDPQLGDGTGRHGGRDEHEPRRAAALHPGANAARSVAPAFPDGDQPRRDAGGVAAPAAGVMEAPDARRERLSEACGEVFGWTPKDGVPAAQPQPREYWNDTAEAKAARIAVGIERVAHGVRACAHPLEVDGQPLRCRHCATDAGGPDGA